MNTALRSAKRAESAERTLGSQLTPTSGSPRASSPGIREPKRVMERVTRPGGKRDADGAESECKDAFEPRKADPCGRADVVKADSSSRASTTDTARISPSASGTSVEVER